MTPPASSAAGGDRRGARFCGEPGAVAGAADAVAVVTPSFVGRIGGLDRRHTGREKFVGFRFTREMKTRTAEEKNSLVFDNKHREKKKTNFVLIRYW